MAQQIDTYMPPIAHLLTGHYRMDRSYRTWREHGADSWLLILTLDGAGRFGYEGGAIRAQAGDATLIRPGVRHDYATDPLPGRWELLWAHFYARPDWREWLAWPEEATGLMQLRLADAPTLQKVTARLFETHRLATGALKQRDAFAMNALEEVVLWCATQGPRTGQTRMDDRVQQCMDYLCRNLADKVTIDGLAARCGLSGSRLAHLFRAEAGMTPQQFQEQQRLMRARQLLELTGRSIQDIATEVGYDNPFYFTLRFKRLTGLSPRDYRKQLR
jgi:AraC family transcriptional regulator of arabinose operon